MRHGIVEVYDIGRIDGLPQETYFEVKMRTGGTPGVTSQADRVAGMHYVVYTNKKLRQVTVDSLQPIRVAHYEVIAIASAFVAADTYLPVERSTDSIALQHLKVYSSMHTAAARPIFGCHLCHCIDWQNKTRAINLARVGQLYFVFATERVNPLVVPIRAIEFVGGKHQVLLLFHGFVHAGIDFCQFSQAYIFADSDAVSHQF